MKLNEKAFIDWNNYLTPEEVKQFLSKDDKVESAENIIYSDEFKKRYQDLHNDLQKKYNNSWTKKELVHDLEQFYSNGHLLVESGMEAVEHGPYKAGDGTWMIDLKSGYSTQYGTNYIQRKTKKECLEELKDVSKDTEEKLDEAIVDKKTFGSKTQNISKYTKQIVNGVFPVLKDKYEISMAPDPINQRPNTVTYTGNDFTDTRVMIDFNTNHRDFEEDGGNQVFSNVFYGMRGAKAGSYNLNNPEETADALVSTLKEIGFKTKDELNQEEIDAYNKKVADKIKEENRIKEAREKRKKDQELIDFNKQLDKEEQPEEPETKQEKEENFPDALTECLTELRERNEINSSIHIAYKGEKEFSIDCYYVSYNQYFVKSDDIDLDKLMKTDDMVKYLITLSNKYKVTACNTYTAPGDKSLEKGLTVHLFS